jgi:uncharacterized protein
MRLSELSIYPLKSGAGLPVASANVEPWGLAGDRRWMLVDQAGVLVSARTDHSLLAVVAEPTGEGGLRLSRNGLDPVVVPPPATDPVPVRLHRHDLLALPAGPAVDAWFARALDRSDVHLVWCDDPTRRPANPAFSRPGDSVSLADGYPVLLTTTASLRQLQDWVTQTALERGEEPAEPLSMRRFRPNVVVDGADGGFVEDEWKRVRIGTVEFRAARASDRCVMTTVDPLALTTGKEPIRTLARYRRWDGNVWFGVNFIPDGPGTVRVGDPVKVLD